MQAFAPNRGQLKLGKRDAAMTAAGAVKKADAWSTREKGLTAIGVVADDETGEESAAKLFALHGTVPDDLIEQIKADNAVGTAFQFRQTAIVGHKSACSAILFTKWARLYFDATFRRLTILSGSVGITIDHQEVQKGLAKHDAYKFATGVFVVDTIAFAIGVTMLFGWLAGWSSLIAFGFLVRWVLLKAKRTMPAAMIFTGLWGAIVLIVADKNQMSTFNQIGLFILVLLVSLFLHLMAAAGLRNNTGLQAKELLRAARHNERWQGIDTCHM